VQLGHEKLTSLFMLQAVAVQARLIDPRKIKFWAHARHLNQS